METYFDEDFKLWLLFRNTHDVLIRLRQRELNEIGVPGKKTAMFITIRSIENEGGAATPSEISRWLLRKPHTVVATLNRMERDGLVKRVKDLEKKNQVRVVITERGEEYFKKASERNTVHRFLSRLSQRERKQLTSILEKLWEVGSKEYGVKPRIPWP